MATESNKNKSCNSNNKRQPRRISQNKRVNYDNTRVQKFDKDMDTPISNKSNDIAWYGKANGLIEGSARLPFSNTTGFTLPYGNKEGVPGVMALTYMPTIGANGKTVNGNIATAAANSYYSYVVHANSRNQSYDAPDLMLATLAGMDALAFIAVGIRAYGVMKLYDQTNRYLPNALLTAMGFDPSDLSSNYSHMLFDINNLIAQASQIWIPDTMPLMQRKFWMNTNIYMDSDSVKGQYYLFVPRLVYKFDERSSEKGTSLTPVMWNTGENHKWADFVNIAKSLISSLVNSQDRGIMFGDILKAYGKEHLYTLSPIDVDYTVTPVYDHEVLTQIENATCGPISVGAITQDEHGIIMQEWDQNIPDIGRGNYFPSQSVLNFHFKEAPTPDQIMIATRLKAADMVYVQNESVHIAHPYATGSEAIYGFYIYYYENEQLQMLPMGNDRNLTMDNVRRWCAFDYAPWLYQFKELPTEGGWDVWTPFAAFGDYDNYTTVNDIDLYRMHTTALMSLFGVPVI